MRAFPDRFHLWIGQKLIGVKFIFENKPAYTFRKINGIHRSLKPYFDFYNIKPTK